MSDAQVMNALVTAEQQKLMLLDALDMMLIGACAVGVPHAAERAVLQEAVDHARETIAKVRA